MNHSLESDFKSVALAQPEDFEQLVNLNVVITGASGFVGRWLVGSWLGACEIFGGHGRLLLTCRNPNRVLEEFPDLGADRRVQFIASDIRTLELVRNFHPNVMIHGATSASEQLNEDDPLEMIDVITSGTKRALLLSEMHGVYKFINLSSGAIYGRVHNETQRIAENQRTGPDVGDPRNAYHEAKRIAELIVNIGASSGKLECVSLRLFTFMAPFLPFNTHFAAGNFLFQATAGRDIVIQSGGGSIRSYLYGTDLVKSIVAVAVRKVTKPALNVGSPDPISIKDLAYTVRDLINPRSRVVIEGDDSEENVTIYVPDTKLIDSEFSLGKRVSLESSIVRTASWIRSQTQFS
jgi:UDP-glucuronate decarboxylase